MEQPSPTTRLKLDRLGIALSGMCAVHCVGSILLVGLLGLGGEWLLSPAIHQYGLALAVLIGALTIGAGVWRHGRIGPLVLGGIGLALMVAALMGPHGLGEAMLTIAGVACVAAAHILNLRFHSF
ncbi:MerC domain-containing protein [Croceicoccus ponticola]|uniref:MerC domain-containing protein n=1 Tax=Croceicoccus ponticola TaxID=2217664 RepID=A0A437GYA5_9SPHN|nr:MerC domain-containing protein [Croceicoccus ponticola]RVQ67667.1 MerC domain-containing protein [Croceicoccus ponticola]